MMIGALACAGCVVHPKTFSRRRAPRREFGPAPTPPRVHAPPHPSSRTDGREIAPAVLEASSARGLRLERELVRGVGLGGTDPQSSLWVAPRAGGLGDEHALIRCPDALSGGDRR